MTRIPFAARLCPKDEEIDALITTDRIRKHFPEAIVDWDRGDEEVRRGIERLREIQAPDFYIEARKRSFGTVAYIEISDKQFPGFAAWFYASFIERDLGDCFDLYSDPEMNIPFLKTIALQISETVGFDYLFSTDSTWGIGMRSIPQRQDPHDFARDELPEEHYGDLAIHPMDDWMKSLRAAVPLWFEQATFKSKQDMIDRAGSIERVATEIIEAMQQIDDIKSSWLVDISAPFSNSLVVEHDEWMSFVSLSGAPKGILK